MHHRPPGVIWVRIEQQEASFLITVTQNANVTRRTEVSRPFADVDGAVDAVRDFLVRFKRRPETE